MGSAWETVSSLIRRPDHIRPLPASSSRTNNHVTLNTARNHGTASMFCWSQQEGMNLPLRDPRATPSERCNERYESLVAAKTACEQSNGRWCGGITRDHGIVCAHGKQLPFELRRSSTDSKLDPSSSWISWLAVPRPQDGSPCPKFLKHRKAALAAPALDNDRVDRLGAILQEKLEIAKRRVKRGPPAFERFPQQAFRFRAWCAS